MTKHHAELSAHKQLVRVLRKVVSPELATVTSVRVEVVHNLRANNYSSLAPRNPHNLATSHQPRRKYQASRLCCPG